MSSHSFSAHPQDGSLSGAVNVTGHTSALSDPGALDALFKRGGSDIWAGKMPTLKPVSKSLGAKSTGVMGAIEMLHDAQQVRGDLLRKVVFAVVMVGLLISAGIGYFLNIGLANITTPAAHAKQVSQADFFNPIQQPKEEAYGMLGVQPTTPTGPMDALAGDESDIRSVEMANANNDPFAPVIVKETKEEEEAPPEIYFSGIVDDPASKRKIAILKIKNPLPGADNPLITVVKRAGEKFTVADKTLSIRSISNNSVQLTVNGEPLTLVLDSFSTVSPGETPNGTTTGLQPLNNVSGNPADGIKPVSDNSKKVNSIRPSGSSILKLAE